MRQEADELIAIMTTIVRRTEEKQMGEKQKVESRKQMEEKQKAESRKLK